MPKGGNTYGWCDEVLYCAWRGFKEERCPTRGRRPARTGVDTVIIPTLHAQLLSCYVAPILNHEYCQMLPVISR